MNETLPDSVQSRIEQYLAYIAGAVGIELPVPQSRIEQWLAYIIATGENPDPNVITIIDDVTLKRYHIGIHDGNFFFEEVVDNG